MMSSEPTFRVPACKSKRQGGCSTCALAYDCVSLQSGRAVPWPLVALLVVGVMSVLV